MNPTAHCLADCAPRFASDRAASLCSVPTHPPATGPIADATGSQRPLTAAALLLRTLIECGVDTVFGYPGGAVLPLYDALHAEPRLRHVLVRHEQAAVHAAEGYARSTGRLGVVFVTSGPGVANTASGLLDAMSDSIPILCISGQVATTAIGTNAFQECDALAITRSVTKWNVQVARAAEVAGIVRHAVKLATTGRPGPVLIDLPKDVQAELFDSATGSFGIAATAAPPSLCSLATPATSLARSLPPEADIAAAARLIAAATRPIFYGGGGLINSGSVACERFTALVRTLDAPCTLTLMGLGAFPASDRRFLGMLGMHGTLEANLAMHEADLVVCAGARFDDRVTGRLQDFCPTAKIVHIDIDPRSLGKVVKTDVGLAGDCAEVLEALQAQLSKLHGNADLAGRGEAKHQGGRLAEWWARIETWRREDCLNPAAPSPRSTLPAASTIQPQELMRTLARRLQGRDAIVSTDVGQHQMWAAQYLAFDHPRRWLTSGGAGTMGYGLPAAIGAQIAHPGRLVVCVSGDASILMNIQELSTALQHRCPVKVVLSNNGCMGMVRQWQELHHGARYSHSYTEALPDFVALAQAFGWQAARVTHAGRLDEAVATCLASPGPYLLDVAVEQQANCFPMIPAGRGQHEIMLAEDRWYRLPPDLRREDA